MINCSSIIKRFTIQTTTVGANHLSRWTQSSQPKYHQMMTINRSSTKTRNMSSNSKPHHDRSQSIGFIGLGAMGREMASNLLRKSTPGLSSFVIYDAFPSATTQFLDNHTSQNFSPTTIVTATSPGAVARLTSTIITMLPSSSEVEEVYLDPETGIISAFEHSDNNDLKDQMICIDSTTLDIDRSKLVSNQLKNKQIQMIDAPVSGGVLGAQNGTLTFMCGGNQNTYHKSESILNKMGKRSIYCGESGTGLAAKMCNNMLLAISMIGTAEAMILGQKLGLKPDLLATIINSSTGRCWSSEVNNPAPNSLQNQKNRIPADEDYKPGFKSKLMSKDLNLTIKAINSISDSTNNNRNNNIELLLNQQELFPLLNVSNLIYNSISNHHKFSDKDFSVVYKWLLEKSSSS